MNEITPIFILFLAGALIGIFLIARWIYFDAKSRGMNPWPWVLLVTLFSPNFIGVLIYIFVRSNNEKSVKCHSCNAKIAVNAKFCPNCGAKAYPETSMEIKRASNSSLIVGIVLLLALVIAAIVGIGMSETGKWGAENNISEKGHYSIGSVSNHIGNKWKYSCKTLNGTETGTLKAKSEHPAIYYSSEITKGTITFELYEKSIDTLMFSFPPNSSGEFTDLQQGKRYYIVAKADKAGGNFLFEMK